MFFHSFSFSAYILIQMHIYLDLYYLTTRKVRVGLIFAQRACAKIGMTRGFRAARGARKLKRAKIKTSKVNFT